MNPKKWFDDNEGDNILGLFIILVLVFILFDIYQDFFIALFF